MRRLNFLDDEPWDEVGDDVRVRWFGHPVRYRHARRLPQRASAWIGGRFRTFSNPTAEPVRMLGISRKRFPDVVAYPKRGVAWVATRHPERPVPESGDEGIIARFELPGSE
jgi:hypothetical protein